jgi:long-chain acyl-CoA synthetase
LKNQLKAIRKPKIITDLRHLVVSGAEMFGDKTLYEYREDGELHRFTYRDNLDHMNKLGTAFAELGLMGGRVAVIGDTHPHYMTAYFATVNGGGVIIPLDRDLTDDAVAGFLNISEASALVYTASIAPRVPNIRRLAPGVKFYIPIHGGDEDGEGVYPMQSLLSRGKELLDAGDTRFTSHVIDMERMCAILFTSGTTGTSKGVMLSQRNLTAATNASCQSMEYDDRNRFVSVLPMHHSYEVTCGHFAIQNLGASIYINDSLKNTLRSFAYFKPNALMLVPLYVETIYKRIWSEIDKKGMRRKVEFAMKLANLLLALGIDVRDRFFGRITEAFGGNLRSIVCGGAPLSPKLVKDFNTFGIILLEGYGITECAPLVSVNSPGKVRYNSVGQPVYGCQVKIDTEGGDAIIYENDKADKKRRPAGPCGEILVKGENVMLGYYRNEEATREAFTPDGWFRTGDVGYMDSDGYIYITGRKKNVIILSNGKNIFPEELEEKLSHVPGVAECVVLGRKNESGEVVLTAVIYPDPEYFAGKTAEEKSEALRASVTEFNRTLPVYKQIRAVDTRETEFEKTSSRKIKRFLVK